MTKANLKNILTAMRDMINRSRIAYKDYLGEETVTETKVLVEGTLSEHGALTLKDPSFTGFVAGKEYEVTIDGTTQTLTAISVNEDVAITNVTDFNNPGENFFIVSVNPENGQPICAAIGTYTGKTISISQTKTTTTKKYDIKKVPQELIPDTIARSVDVAKVKMKAYDAFNKANAAQSAANNAQFTANNARSTADAAKTAADAAKTAADNAIGADVVKDRYILRTGQNKDRGYGFSILYKESNGTEEVLSFFGPSFIQIGDLYLSEDTIKLRDSNWSKIELGDFNSDNYVRIENNSGGSSDAKLTLSKYYMSELKAKQTVLYNSGKIDCPNHTLEINGLQGKSNKDGSAIILTSATPESTKRFKITVDDSGIITATEVI